jgi:hypothetical protein
MVDFQQTLEQGKIGESLIAKWLIERGIHILPAYEKVIEDYKGPVLYSSDVALIAPDLLCFNTGERKVFWVEAKNKSAFSWYRKDQIWTTGIDTYYFNQYLQVRTLLDYPVFLMFLQNGGHAKDSPLLSPSGLYGGELLKLAQNINHTYTGINNYGHGGMTYWAIRSLTKYAELPDVI